MVEKAFLRKNVGVIKGKKCNPTNIFLKQKTHTHTHTTTRTKVTVREQIFTTELPTEEQSIKRQRASFHNSARKAKIFH